MDETENMTSGGPASEGGTPEPEVVYCYGHPNTETRLRCSRCDKPICPRCSVPASVGQHCVWCVAEARKTAPKVRSTMQATSPGVLAIIAICVAVYLLESFWGDDFIVRFAASPANIAFENEYYRLITPMFLHAPLGARLGILHILFNMYILRIYGPQVETTFGTPRFIAMYLVAGFLGGAVSFAFGNCAELGLGASGAVFGVIGILLVVLYNRRDSTAVADHMRTLLTFVGLNLVIGFVMPGIDYLAHLGGLGSGMLLGLGMDGGRAAKVSSARQIATIAAVAALGIALVVWRIDAMPFGCAAFIR